MNFIRTAVRWRHGTFVLFCLLAMFGILALFSLPLSCNQVVIAHYNYYSLYRAGPAEVEDLITVRLKKCEVEGVEEITSSRAGLSSITIEFSWGTDVDARLVDACCSRWRLYRKKRVNLMSKWLVVATTR